VALCGVEVPLQSNRQLLAAGESDRSIHLAEFDDSRLCRYSFAQISSLGWGELVEAVVNQVAGAATWCFVWHHDDAGDLRMRSRVRASTLKKDGFDVHIDGDVATATILLSGCAEDGLRPRRQTRDPVREGTLILLLGDGSVGDKLRSQVSSRTVQTAARTGHFAPNRSFAGWLAVSGVQVIYGVRDSLERPGLVCITHAPLDVEELVAQRIVSDVRLGESASSVWM
jgi:hypothetical protein